MSHPTRREFLRRAAAIGSASALPACASRTQHLAPAIERTTAKPNPPPFAP